MSNDSAVCVVTHPLSNVSETAVSGLLEVVAAARPGPSLITANLPNDSAIREEYDFVEVSSRDTGESVLVAAVRFFLNQLRICWALRRRDEEIVLFFGATSYVLPILVARLSGKKVILEPRGNVPDSLYRIWSDHLPNIAAFLLSRPVWLLERVGYRMADAILTLSPAMADDLSLHQYRVKLHEWGVRPVDVERFSPSKPVQDRPRRIGYLGRLDEEKGVDTLIEVVQHLPEDTEFVFIGDGALRSEIKMKLADRIEAGSVEITGWVDHENVPTQLRQIRMLVSTSPTEGVPTTVIESLACGTPVAAFPVGGISDVVEDGETGLLLEDREPKSVATRIASQLDRPEELTAMSETAREFAVTEFGFDVVVQRYEQVFDSVEEQ